MKWHIQAISAGLLGLGTAAVMAACTQTPDVCGRGEPIVVDGVEACLYRAPITETGFDCPPQFGTMYKGSGFAFCSGGPTPSEQAFDEAAWKAGAAPRPVDILFVVDNSTSMAEEQVRLTQEFNRLLDIAEEARLDLRVAVTTADAQCDDNGGTVTSSNGRFNAHAATGFPPAVYGREIHQCMSDADCSAELGADWKCQGATTTVCQVNPNGTLNTQCRAGCGLGVPPKPMKGAPEADVKAYEAAVAVANRECEDLFGTPYYCHMPSGSQADWGCMPRPQTSECPADLPAVLEGEDLKYFPCIATVGVIQDKCFKYEQGLKTARLALDVKGPNASQAADFLRPNAHLAVVFVTDEDDCSLADGATLSEDYYDRCAIGAQVAHLEGLGRTVSVEDPLLVAATTTTDRGGPLVPVSEYVAFFKGLKPLASMVSVAVLTGASDDLDTLSAFVASKGSLADCYKMTYLCDTSLGKTDWGSRYLQLAAELGAQGVVASLCDESGTRSVLEQLGAVLSK